MIKFRGFFTGEAPCFFEIKKLSCLSSDRVGVATASGLIPDEAMKSTTSSQAFDVCIIHRFGSIERLCDVYNAN